MTPEDAARMCKLAREHDWRGYFRLSREVKDRELQSVAEIVAPGPEVTSRDPWPSEIVAPRPAAALIKLAESNGWLTDVRYSRGSVVTRRREAGRVVERRHCVSVRMWHSDRRVHAAIFWEAPAVDGPLTWKAAGALWRAGGGVPAHLGITELKARLA